MTKSIKQYCFLRAILAQRLRKKKREIEALKLKAKENRFFISGFGLTIDLKKVNGIKVQNYKWAPQSVFLEFYDDRWKEIGYVRISKDNENIESEFMRASNQLKEYKKYD